jgi:hypothetical protein
MSYDKIPERKYAKISTERRMSVRKTSEPMYFHSYNFFKTALKRRKLFPTPQTPPHPSTYSSIRFLPLIEWFMSLCFLPYAFSSLQVLPSNSTVNKDLSSTTNSIFTYFYPPEKSSVTIHEATFLT